MVNSRERVFKALELEEVDLIPYCGEFSSLEAETRFLGERVIRAKPLEKTILIARMLNSDIVTVPITGYPGGPGVFEEVIAEGDDHIIVKTPFGSLLYWRKRPYFSLVLSGPIKNEEDIDSIERPDVQIFLEDIRKLARDVEKLHELGYFVRAEFKGVFESSWMYLAGGLVNMMKHMVLNPKLAEKIVSLSFSVMLDLMDLVIDETEIDAIWITEDLGEGKTPFISPEKYRGIIKPWHEKAVRRVHSKGVKVCLHSHGNIMPLLDDIVDVGFDSIDPLDPADGIDLQRVKERYGDKVCLMGGITRDIGRMPKEELAKHVREVFTTLGPIGFIACEAGGIPPEMTLESFNEYMKILQEVRKVR